nr:unnamed protein product [Digitaria exilis]
MAGGRRRRAPCGRSQRRVKDWRMLVAGQGTAVSGSPLAGSPRADIATGEGRGTPGRADGVWEGEAAKGQGRLKGWRRS